MKAVFKYLCESNAKNRQVEIFVVGRDSPFIGTLLGTYIHPQIPMGAPGHTDQISNAVFLKHASGREVVIDENSICAFSFSELDVTPSSWHSGPKK